LSFLVIFLATFGSYAHNPFAECRALLAAVVAEGC
jgi:hypothetical protein